MEVQFWRRAAAVLLAAALAACGGESPSRSAGPSPPPPAYAVSSITDGDTLRFSPALDGTTTLRMLNIDAPEAAQAPWGAASRDELIRLAPAGTEMTLETDRDRLDGFGRLLAHAIRRDGLNLNAEQLRRGQAVLYVIWPNTARFEEYRAAQIEARAAGRGLWNAAAPLRELPFEYRLRIDGGTPFRPVGDFFTHAFVDPPDFGRVHVNNRVFFDNRSDAAAAGYAPCPRDGSGAYSAACFAAGE
jgi:endonuclease YncB( thermonuclease family)